MIKEENGITLVALVVTVIVLIVLSGVTIFQITSEDTILDDATNEVAYQDEAVENEQKKMNQVVQSQMEDWGF